jgi:hypothetical protein
MEELHAFSAGSKNDTTHKHLWLKGASLFIPQLNKLLEHTDYRCEITDIDYFKNDCCKILNNESEKLKTIFTKNGSDKSTAHNYQIVYSYILNKLGVNSELNILEIGLGTNNPNLVSTMTEKGIPGASLFSFREYLPNAKIYGGDIDTNILFESERIKTSYVDQLNIDTYTDMLHAFGNIKFDLIIDDGLHSIAANFNTLLFALNNLNDNGWLVIEDIHIIGNWKIIDSLIKPMSQYKTYIVKTSRKHVYLLNKLPSL